MPRKSPQKNRKPIAAPKTSGSELLNAMTVTAPSGSQRPLSEDEKATLLAMMTIKRNDDALDWRRLAPRGSILEKAARLYDETDIAYALPLFEVIMMAASTLTQGGAVLNIDGMGDVVPSLWTMALAESGSSKTLATTRMRKVLEGPDREGAVSMLPPAATDAQWILDLKHDNGAYWVQDEAGKFFAGVFRDKNMARMKPWMLNAYSHEEIGNRLKGEKEKLRIERPTFTFWGLSVLSTWREDVPVVHMLDGFAQRPQYVIAVKRQDCDMFEHFTYFTEPGRAEAEAQVHEIWMALRAQPGTSGRFSLDARTLPWLRAWWRGLRSAWGGRSVPESYIRRIGFSVLKYLPVLHWLLGKAGRPIDLETALLATRYAEFHLESTRVMLANYDTKAESALQTILGKRDQLQEAGKDASARNITQRLSKGQRAEIPHDVIVAVLNTLDGVRVDGELLADCTGEPKARSAALMREEKGVRERLALNERKRNERRLRELRKALRARKQEVHGLDATVIGLFDEDWREAG